MPGPNPKKLQALQDCLGEVVVYSAWSAPNEKYFARLIKLSASYAHVTFDRDPSLFMVSLSSLTPIRDIIKTAPSTLDTTMGFDYNPFRHIEIVETNPTNSDTGLPVLPQTFEWYCHNCGGQSSSKEKTWQIDELHALLDDWYDHLARSHRTTRFDFKDSSDL